MSGESTYRSPGIASLLLLCCLFSSMSVRADFLNLTGAETAANIAEIYILDDRVKVVLEIYVGDIGIFKELVPDDFFKDKPTDRPSLQARLQKFSDRGFQVITESGKKLSATLDRVEPRMRVDRKSLFAGSVNPITRQRIGEAPADKRVLYAELNFPFEQKPTELTFIPPQDETGRARVSMGFIAYHKSVPIIDFRYLGAPARVRLDWTDPWYTKFDNPNLKRHHKSALMSFLYVEPYEVRHEVLVRVRDMETFMELGLRGDSHIEVDELQNLKQRVGEFLLGKNRLLVDDKDIKPILDRTNFVKVSLAGIQLLEAPERLEISTAIIGVIITYLTDGLPQQVTVDWELFTEQVQEVPATAIDPAGPLMSILIPDESVHTWTNFLKKYTVPTVNEVLVKDSLGNMRIPAGPIVSLAMLPFFGWFVFRRRRQGKPMKWLLAAMGLLVVGGVASYPLTGVVVSRPALVAGELADAQSKLLLETLLKNVYRAFDFRDEEDVYDKLALTVKGDLLADIYLQSRRSFAIKKAGGAQAKIKSVEIEDARAKRLESGPLGYAITGRWTALGTVGHWGHLHTRKNLYDAVVTVEAIDGQWKITDLELLEEQRIDPNKPVPKEQNRSAG